MSQTGRQLYLSAVLSLWDRGMDTFQIAQTLRDDQAMIERALHEALEQRKGVAHGRQDSPSSA